MMVDPGGILWRRQACTRPVEAHLSADQPREAADLRMGKLLLLSSDIKDPERAQAVSGRTLLRQVSVYRPQIRRCKVFGNPAAGNIAAAFDSRNPDLINLTCKLVAAYISSAVRVCIPPSRRDAIRLSSQPARTT